MLFDTHAHLNDPAFDKDREELISSLPEKGIEYVMNVGCCLDSSKDCIAMAEKYPFVYASVGSHPDSAGEVCEELMETYLQMAKHPKVKAIGEIGLDYYYEGFDKQTQIRAFKMQMELARQAELPVIIHERDAHGDGMEVVREFPDVTGVFHCYSGAAEMARQLVNRGWYIGFTGVLTFKNARKAVETAASIPLERIVLETDCPYMSPEPYRGKRNDPGRLIHMAEKLAQIRGLPVEEVIEITTENAKRLYRI
ncbi:MAG: TatD family deoxyribonuclease [Ruminococcaceae bacterium]|nr:TatD family deoxyribonuclease [Oscillospiraceae bacterium]